MGALGKPERKSERKAEAARRNARAPRPGARRAASAGEEDTLRQALSELRRMAPEAVALLRRVLGSKDEAVAVRAAAETLDRAGVPRKTESAVMLTEAPKLFEIVHYPPPPAWNGDDGDDGDHVPALPEVPHALPPARMASSINGDARHPLPESEMERETEPEVARPAAPPAPPPAPPPQSLVATLSSATPRWSRCPACQSEELMTTASSDGRVVTTRCLNCNRFGRTKVEEMT